MTTAIATGQRANLVGSLWMIAAMMAFAIEDSLVKATAKTLPIGEILILFGLGGAFVFACVTLFNGRSLFVADVLSPPMRIRMGFEITGRLFYALAIAMSPLSSATVILQATPLVVVAGAAVIFGENVGWRRWLAVLIGLVGVVIIVEPGRDGFSILSLLAVIGMVGFAGRDLASRAAPLSLGTSVLGFYGFLAIIVAGTAYSPWAGEAFVMPGLEAMLYLAGAVLVGTLAYSFLMKAMRTGDVSAVTPFRYSRLLFGVLFGVVLFGERLDFNIVIGSCLIVFSGLFIMWRGRRVTSR